MQKSIDTATFLYHSKTESNLSVTKGNTDITSGLNYEAVRINVVASAFACLAGCAATENLFKRNGLGNSVVDGNHLAALAFEESINCKGTELGAEASVILAGLAAALGVTDVGSAYLLAVKKSFKLRSKLVANATETNGICAVRNYLFDNNVAALRLCTLGNNDNGIVKALCIALLDNVNDLVDIVGDLGEKNDISTAGKTALKSEPTAVSSHNL